MKDSGVFIDTSSGCRRFLIDDSVVQRLDSSPDKINASMVKIFIYSYLSLLSDSPLAKTKGQKPYRLFVLLYKQIVTEGLKPFVLRMADLSHTWVSQLTIMGGGPTTGDFLDDFKDTPIFKEYLEWYRSADPELMRYIYTFLVFGKKMWYVDEELNSIAFREWERVEEKLSGLSLPEDVIPWLKDAISSLISPAPDVPVFPKFGPGSVFELGLKGSISKSNNLRYDPCLDRAFFRSHFVNYGLSSDLGYNPDKFYLGMKPKNEEKHHGLVRSRVRCPRSEDRGCVVHDHTSPPDEGTLGNPVQLAYQCPDPGGTRESLLRLHVHGADLQSNRTEFHASSEHVSRSVSRLRFVPKTLKTARSICMESNTRMCFQQAYLGVLLSQMDNPLCRSFINFRSQERNRRFAEYGSYTGELDTIDLSAASDSVHIDLVRRVFPRRELYFLLATRSSQVDVGNLSVQKIRKVHKFAPMGSALCFPVQSLIFTGVVLVAAIKAVFDGSLPNREVFLSEYTSIGEFVDKHFMRNARWVPSSKKLFLPGAVYGDDICVDRRLTPYVTSLLADLGFTVNNGKSFVGSQAFRESCGAYYWQGHDITPTYFRIPYHREPNAEVFMSALSLANLAGDRRYLNLRRYLIHFLLEVYRHVRFTDSREDTCAVYSTSVRNSHLRRRYNNDYQRDEIWGMAVEPAKRRRPKKREINAFESYLYLRWQASRVAGVIPEDLVSSAPRYDASGARLAGRWTPG